MRTSKTVIIAVIITAVGIAGCSAAPIDSSEAEIGVTSEPLLAGCTEAAIRAATPADRKPIIDRALHWVDARVPYSQSAHFEGYRTDCSGFVSMAWQLPTSRLCSDFAPYEDAVSHAITQAALLPGDALNRNYPTRDGRHIMLFAGWLDAAHSKLCVIQENESGTPANLRAYGSGWFNEFQPIRFNGAPGAHPTPPSTECTVQSDHKLWCVNRPDAMRRHPTPSSDIVDQLQSRHSWFDCWAPGTLHAGGNTTWYHTEGDVNGAAGWVPGVDLETPSAFDANPSAHNLPRCGSGDPMPGTGCTVHPWDKRLWCTNEASDMYYASTTTSGKVDQLHSTFSWFDCWGEGALHAGGNTTWYRTVGDANGEKGWVPAVALNTSSAFDANPTAQGLKKCPL